MADGSGVKYDNRWEEFDNRWVGRREEGGGASSRVNPGYIHNSRLIFLRRRVDKDGVFLSRMMI